MVRITVDTPAAAEAVPYIREQLDKMDVLVPLIGDFHYNGHTLLNDFPECAKALSKYRINPGNVGKGAKRDPQFGTMILVGLGGVQAELWKDVALDVAPVSPEGAMAMLRSLKAFPLLDGFRGSAPVNVAQVAETIAQFSAFAAAMGERLEEAEINPLFVLPQGQGVRAADGTAHRYTFVVDPDNVIQHVYATNHNVGRNPKDTLRVLDALQTDELCPCNREVGGATLANAA